MLGACLLLAAFTGWYGLGRQGLMTWDEGNYYDGARFVIQAATAVLTHTDIAHATTGFAPRMARPLNVALNIVAMSILGIHQWVPAALAGLFGIVCIYCTYALGRRILDERTGLIAAWLLTISPYFLQYRRVGLPEVAGTLAALLVLLRLVSPRDREEPRPRLSSLGLGLLLGAAFAINMRLGVLLPIAVLFRLLWSRKANTEWHPWAHLVAMAAGVAAVVAVFELPYHLLPLLVHTSVPIESYANQLRRFLLTQQGMGRPPLPLSYLAPLVFLGYFEAPVLGLAVYGVLARPHLWRQPAALVLVVCVLAQLLVLGLITPFARYLSWIQPALMILAAYGLARLADRVPARVRAATVAVVVLLCLVHAGFRAAPFMQAHGAMREAAVWLAAEKTGRVITSDQSIALNYLDLPLAQLPIQPQEARQMLSASGQPTSYVLLDRQQFMRDTFVMSEADYAGSAAATIRRGASPVWTARQFEGLFLPFCFEHNRNILQTLRTGRDLAPDAEVIGIYRAEDALRALSVRGPEQR